MEELGQELRNITSALNSVWWYEVKVYSSLPFDGLEREEKELRKQNDVLDNCPGNVLKL